MSDRYRPPTGPKGPKGPRGHPPSNYKSGWKDQEGKGADGKRFKERDNYRPNVIDRRRGPDDGDDRYYNRDRNDKNDRYERNDRNDRPLGPSGSRDNRGQKRGPPERDPRRGPGGDRPNKRRDFNARDYDNDRAESSKPEIDRPPRAPKSSGYQGPGARPGPRPGPRTGPNNRPTGPGGGSNAGPNAGPNQRDRPKQPPKKRTPNPNANQNKKPQQRLQPSQLYSLYANRSNELYKRVQQVGEGTYGKVYKAKNSLTEEFVALKRLRLESEREGFPITAMREIKLLQSFDHPNIVGLLEMMVEHNQIFMIFDYLDHDLTGLLTHPDLKLTEGHRKTIFKQLMEGMNYLHARRVIHRDIKGSNILVDREGTVKVADFGLARTMKVLKDGESPDYTNRVITIWYRPPELLLGSVDYGREVDIWGVGCLLIELYTKMAVFQGTEEISQLYKIFDIMGTPSVDSWPDIENLPWFEMLKPRINKKSSFESEFRPLMSEQSFDLAQKMLSLVPSERISAEDSLQHAYFTEDPKPEALEFMKTLEGEWHEFETKKRRREERKRLAEMKNAKGREVSLPPTQPAAPNPANEHAGFQTPLSTEQAILDDINNGLESKPNAVMGLDEIMNHSEPHRQATEDPTDTVTDDKENKAETEEPNETAEGEAGEKQE